MTTEQSIAIKRAKSPKNNLLKHKDQHELRGRHRALVLLAVVLAGFISFGRNLGRGGTGWPDESVHAMDGALIHDWVAAGPVAWRRPVTFAQHQYARYPAMGIGLHYPPGLASFKAMVFAVTGVSITAARATVVLFGLLACVGAYLLLEREYGAHAGLMAAGGLMAAPLIVLWSRQAMLEMPTLAVMVWASLLLLWYLQRPSWGRMAIFTAVTVAIPFFKQQGVFLLPVLLGWMAIAWRRGRVPGPHALAAMLAATTLVSPFFAAILLRQGHVVDLISMGRPMGEWLGWENWQAVFKGIVSGAGRPLLVLAGIGLILGAFRRGRIWRLAVAWLLASVLFNVLVQYKEPRFLFYSILPVALLAAVATGMILRSVDGKKAAALGLAMLFAGAIAGYRQAPPELHDYAALVSTYADEIRGNLVMFVGRREPDFILAAREVLGPQGTVVLRGSKLFYVCASDPRFAYEQFAHSVEDIEEIIERYSPHAIFIDHQPAYGLEPEKLCRKYLQSAEQYRLAAVVNSLGRGDRYKPISVYLRVAPHQRTVTDLRLLLPIVGAQLQVDLKSLGIDCGQ